MSVVKTRCKYENRYTRWKCPYEALEDSKEGFCIFHEKRKDKDIKKFNGGIKKILEGNDLDAYHFEGFFFPDSISFRGFKFKKNVFFRGAEFTGEGTDFSGVEFSGENTDFAGAKFSGESTSFYDAKFFGKNTFFSVSEFSGKNIEFVAAKFSGENTYFDHAKFSGESTHFSRSEFSGKNTYFQDVRFSGVDSNFIGAKFLGEEIYFTHAEFSGKTVNFWYSESIKRIVFHQTVFRSETNFIGVDLRKSVFSMVDLKNVDFSLLKWDWKYKLKNETELEKLLNELNEKEDRFYFKTSEIYRQLKVQFHNKRDFAKAGMLHFREQECKRKACKLPREFFKWIFLWILKLSCGYGEKLTNVGLTSIALIFLFAIGFMFFGLHNADNNASVVFNYDISLKNIAPVATISRDFGTSLVFSVKGFFPLWRFQQYKVVGDTASLAAGFEFVLGGFMVGLFVYVFRRRMEK